MSDIPAGKSIDHADVELRKALRGFHRLRWAVVGVLAALLVMAIVTGVGVIVHQQEQIDALRSQLRAGCSFYTDLAKAPLQPVPPVNRPSRLGVTIVVDSRMAAFGFGCDGIPPVSGPLKKWAAYYHIPVR